MSRCAIHGRLCQLLLLALLLFTGGCQSLKKTGRSPVLNVPAGWNVPGTIVVYMPKALSAAKQRSGDPTYLNWAEALMGYVDESYNVTRIIDQGRMLSSETHISSKTVPSSDYSVLLVGRDNKAVHVMDSWQSTELFLLVDPYLKGEAKAKSLPPGCEALRLRVPEQEPQQQPAAADKTR